MQFHSKDLKGPGSFGDIAAKVLMTFPFFEYSCLLVDAVQLFELCVELIDNNDT